jgi:outer membrane protein OmpA-like peptidoglycan-associated protein
LIPRERHEAHGKRARRHGARFAFPDVAVLPPLYALRIGADVMDTAAACRTFNILVGEGRNAVAAIIVVQGGPDVPMTCASANRARFHIVECGLFSEGRTPMIRCIIVAATLALLPLAASAQEEWKQPHVAGAKEHRILKFYPESSVDDYQVIDFDAVEMVVGHDRKKSEVTTTSIEGKVTKYHSNHKPGTSALQMLRNYENALKKAGFVTLVAGKGEQLPGAPINFDQSLGTFRLDADGKPAVYVTMIAGGDAQRPDSTVTIVEVKAMEQKLEANADSWFDEIRKSGRVAVYGINFETGKASITPDSAAVLEEVRKLAAGHPELKLVIEGHTDNVGGTAANRKLSEARAGAVRAWLVGKGVGSAQLSAAGLGDTKPVGDNATEQGRAANRRVELVRG